MATNVNIVTDGDVTQTVTSGTELATVGSTKIYAPTIPVSLKNPNALTLTPIDASGSSGTAVPYDGSVSKSMNVVTAHQDISGKQNAITPSNKLAASLVSGLANVATSGSYSDLSNPPTIPTVNNPTIKITQGGTEKGSFTLNQSSGDTIALDAGGGGSGFDHKVILIISDFGTDGVSIFDSSGNETVYTSGTYLLDRSLINSLKTNEQTMEFSIDDATAYYKTINGIMYVSQKALYGWSVIQLGSIQYLGITFACDFSEIIIKGDNP